MSLLFLLANQLLLDTDTDVQGERKQLDVVNRWENGLLWMNRLYIKKGK